MGYHLFTRVEGPGVAPKLFSLREVLFQSPGALFILLVHYK